MATTTKNHVTGDNHIRDGHDYWSCLLTFTRFSSVGPRVGILEIPGVATVVVPRAAFRTTTEVIGLERVFLWTVAHEKT